MQIRGLSPRDLHPQLLADFQRHQVTWAVVRGEEVIQDYFEEDWDDQGKGAVLAALKECLENGGAVIGAFDGHRLIGFASLQGKPLGSDRQYLELDYLHVSRDNRGQGVGQKLFQELKAVARERGARKLYIGAHPAVETQAFYRRVGCVPAEEVQGEIFQRQPLDIQLEYQL